MPSWNAVWIPALASAEIIGVAMMLYALEQLHGTVTALTRFFKWKLGLYTAEELQQWSVQNKLQTQAEDTANLPERKKPKRKRKSKSRKRGKDSAAQQDDENLPITVELSWDEISYTVQPGGASTAKMVLFPCSGSFFPCEAIAIMGPSGAGKSTLLDILSSRTNGKGVEGYVTINGTPLTPELSNIFISYIGQEDVFMPTLSAWESLSFVTQLCMEATSKSTRETRMNTVLDTMGLLRVKHSKVGGYLPGGVEVRGLSGGEKRRLSIACGLIGNPSIVFLDEPTTGLDSFAALAVMKYLNALTDRGHTIVSSIHQPRQEIFSLFDKVLVLSAGYLLYLAPPSYVVPWFSQVLLFPYIKERDGTVADWLITVVAVSFRKGTDSRARSMSSIEEVQAAAQRFEDSAQVMREAEDVATSYMETDDLESLRDLTSVKDAPLTDGPSTTTEGAGLQRRNSETSVLSGSVFSGLSSKAGAHLLRNMQAAEMAVSMPEDAANETGEPSFKAVGRRYSRSWFFQFAMLWKRSIMHQLRNPAEAALRAILAPISGIIPGLVWIRLNDNANSSQERLALLFFAIVLFCMTPFGFMAFPLADKRFFILDSARGLYTPSAYCAAHILSNLPFFIMNAWASALVTYGLAGLRYQGWAILQSMGIITLHAVTTSQFITMCIWITSSQDMAFSIATIYISFSLLICGFYIRVRNMILSVVRALTWVSFSKYTFQGLALTELKNRQWSDQVCQPATTTPDFAQSPPLCSFPQNYILYYYDVKLTVAQACAALLGFWALFCLLSYYALLRLYARKR